MKPFLPIMFVSAVLGGIPAAVATESGLTPETFDPSVRAQDDLYLHVNKNWLETTEIPADRSNYGAFTELIDLSQERLKEIIEQAADGDHAPGSDPQKVGDFYQSFMNQQLVEKLGITPVRQELDTIGNLGTKSDVITHFGHLQQLGVQTPIGFNVRQDDRNSIQYLAAISQSGTTLPDRGYYLKDDEKMEQARVALAVYVERLLTLSGEEDAADTAREIVQLETALARVQWERTELRDPLKTYNKYAVSKLPELTPGFEWMRFFTGAQVGDLVEVNVVTPSFFEGLAEIFQETELALWRKYLQFKLLDSYAPALSKDFVDAHFQLHSKVLGGVPEQKPRWKRAVDATAGARAGDFGVLGEVVGRLYVARYFLPEEKARMDQLVRNLGDAFRQSISELTWMTGETKARAQEKLATITTKIGYPDKWRDYSPLEIDENELVGNLKRSARYEYNRMIKKLGQRVDRAEWGMTPQTVNAYYNPGMNEIVFPAAILQPPFFNMAADDAVNYGGIGAVIGHEISHGFDDQGSQYDGDGNLRNWWTEKDRAAFTALADKLVAQFNAYQPLPGKHVNAELTLGENIADLSGLAIAFKAYMLSLGGKPAPVIDGLSGEQRFFMGWSQVWRRKYREAELIRRLLTDPHSPSKYRTNGPVTNIDGFYKAFDLKPGDALYKPESERIKIW